MKLEQLLGQIVFQLNEYLEEFKLLLYKLKYK